MTIYPPRLRISYDVTCGAADSGSRAGSTQCQANGRRHKQRPEGGDLRNDVKLQPMTCETKHPMLSNEKHFHETSWSRWNFLLWIEPIDQEHCEWS